ncbi:hypothetical protein ACJMK2_000281 [Sinanodonta woodiana]|uniref:Uncharacterized protein n=1 Tax=Sinanodonta woodiana TaxID=1069815 RepID=A0ABD3XSD0_SINWO
MASALRQEEQYLPILTCSLCLKTLKRPRVLPCGHTYCCSCLQSHINDKLVKREAADDTFPCPVCRAETSLSSSAADGARWAYSFPINKMVVSLLDKTTVAGIEANCQVCCKRGRTTSASSYCNECNKYLCDTCREYHDDLRIICQNSVHRLNTGIDSKSVNPNISFVEMCPKHVEERIKLFCIDHSTLCCSTCGFLNHMKCDNINTLDGMIKEFNVQMKSEKIGTYLKDLENQLKHIKTTVKRNVECIQREKDAILHELRTLTSSLNAKLQKIENDLTCCLEQMYTVEDINFELLGGKIDSLITAIESDHAQIDLVKTYGSEPQKVIVLHTMEQNLNRYFSSISEFQEDIKNVSFKFEVDKIFTSLLNACNGIGTVRVTRLKSKLPPCPTRDLLAHTNVVKTS